jgi:hypothetical protein
MYVSAFEKQWHSQAFSDRREGRVLSATVTNRSTLGGIAVTKRETHKERGWRPSEVKGLRFALIHSSDIAPEWTIALDFIHPAF